MQKYLCISRHRLKWDQAGQCLTINHVYSAEADTELNIFFFLERFSEMLFSGSTAEYGSLTFSMDMYKTEHYQNPYKSYPVWVHIKDTMYLEVKVISNESQLVLFPLKCWATPTNDSKKGESYRFIYDG